MRLAFVCAWMSRQPDSNLTVVVNGREQARDHGNN